MTTPQTASPFAANIKNNVITSTPQPSAPQAQGDFLIRTMQSDIAELHSKGSAQQPLPVPNAQPQTPAPAPSSVTAKPFPMTEPRAAFQDKRFSSSDNKIVPTNIMAEVPTDKILLPQAEKNSSLSSIKIVIAVITVLIICIAGLGAYYFLITKSANKTVPVAPAVVAAPQPAPQPQPAEVAPPVEKYSTDKPNYLPLDLTTITSTDIENTILNVASDLKSTTASGPYEFIVVDSNNNPVAFPIFALAAKLNLSPDLLSSLGTNFSLYLFKDGNNVRLAFSSDIQSKDQLNKQLPLQEKTFVSDGSFLFLNAVPEIKNGVFSTGSYGNYSIRYLNLDAANDLSIDYTLTPSQLVIGTSKNTERAVLDKLTSGLAATDSKNSPASTVSNTTTSPVAVTSNPDCSSFPDMLATCSAYVCNYLPGQALTQTIVGMVSGKCEYTQQLPNNGSMKCDLTADMQQKIAATLKTFAATGNASFSTTGNATGSSATSTVNGQTNPLQDAITTKQCVISGY